MKKEQPIEQMFQEILQSLRNWKMSKYSVNNYYYEGIRPIRTYYGDAGLTMYDEAFTESIVADLQRKYDDGIVTEGICKTVRKLADMMKQYDNGFKWSRIKHGAKEKLASAYYTDLLNKYYDDECKIGLRSVLTADKNVTNIRHFFRWLEKYGKATLEQITLKDAGDFLTYYGELRPYTISEMLGSLRNLHAFIQRQNIPGIDFSPALIARPASRSKLMPSFTQSQAEEILSGVVSVMFRLIYCCGLRPVEARQLHVDDVDLETGQIKVLEAKRHKDRIVVMADDMLMLARKYNEQVSRKYPNRSHFFYNRFSNGIYSNVHMLKTFKKLLNAAEIKKISPKSPRAYDLRHTFATHRLYQWLQEGEDIDACLAYLSEYMGHANLSDTAYYIHLVPEFYPHMAELGFQTRAEILPEVPV